MANRYRPIYYAEDDKEEENPIDELQALEDMAETANPQQQGYALITVATTLDANQIPYGTMGGFNFWNRGNVRTTGDVDLAVGREQTMADILNLFNNDPRISRPDSAMQWVAGVARIFVDVDGQKVQVDLKRQGVEGQGIPSGNLNDAGELLQVRDIPNSSARFLNIQYVVYAKMRAFKSRVVTADYEDLVFICASELWNQQVRQVADYFPLAWREEFVARVHQEDAAFEARIRWALKLDEQEREKSAKIKNQIKSGKDEHRKSGGGDELGGKKEEVGFEGSSAEA